MQTQNRFFDDLSKVATGAVGAISGLGKEMEAVMRQRFEDFIGGMDLVRRDEFEAVKELAANARAEADALKARLEALEAAMGKARAKDA
jgi:BMFP domain-containing protein YqiC